MVQAKATVYREKPVRIKFKGNFVIDDLYSEIKKWFSENKLDFYELLYKDKPDPLKTRTMEIKLFGEKKVTEYYKHEVNIRILVNNYKEKQVKNGKIGQGKVIIEINGTIIADYEDLFDVKGKSWVNKFYKWLGSVLFYVRKVEFVKKEIASLAKELAMLSKAIRKILNMESSN